LHNGVQIALSSAASTDYKVNQLEIRTLIS